LFAICIRRGGVTFRSRGNFTFHCTRHSL